MNTFLYRTKPRTLYGVKGEVVLRAAKNSWNNLPQWVQESYEAGDIVFGNEEIFIRTEDGEQTAGVSDYLMYDGRGLTVCKGQDFDIFFESTNEK